jgi:FMN phosphatase YigB (HAD superfamily)
MLKALFLDFYGTIVEENDDYITEVCSLLSNMTEEKIRASEIGGYWSKQFVYLCNESFGDKFITQRDIQRISLENTLNKFNINHDAIKLCEPLWESESKPNIFKESLSFLNSLSIPFYIISNIDNDEILKAIEHIAITPGGVITSELARSYKPRNEIYDLALDMYSLRHDEVIHIGDSFSSDIVGAASMEIKAIWINRRNRSNPSNSTITPYGACNNLSEVLQYIK